MKLAGSECQVRGCDSPLDMVGAFYIRPLELPAKGHDHVRNLLCLCSSHSQALECGEISIVTNPYRRGEEFRIIGPPQPLKLRTVLGHSLLESSIDYHLKNIYRPPTTHSRVLSFFQSFVPGFCELNDVKLETVETREQAPNYERADGEKREYDRSYMKEGDKPNGNYFPESRSEVGSPCIWIDGFYYNGGYDFPINPGFLNPSAKMTEKMFATRALLPLEAIEVAVLHECAHHLDLVGSGDDPDLVMDDGQQHRASWAEAYRGLLSHGLKRGLINSRHCELARTDIEERNRHYEFSSVWPG